MAVLVCLPKKSNETDFSIWNKLIAVFVELSLCRSVTNTDFSDCLNCSIGFFFLHSTYLCVSSDVEFGQATEYEIKWKRKVILELIYDN